MVFQHWIRATIHEAAGEAMRQALGDSLRSSRAASDPPSDQQAHPSHSAAEEQGGIEFPVQVGIVVALPAEAEAIKKKMENPIALVGEGFTAYAGRIGPCPTAIVTAGPGEEPARRATAALLLGHRPRYILAAGFAGGLVPQLDRYDIVIPSVLLHHTGRKLRLDAPPAFGAEDGVESRGQPWKIGPLLTAQRVIREPEEKQRLAAETGAWAVDMESFAVAEVCRAAKIPMLAVRVISDTWDERLPKEVAYLLDKRHLAQQVGYAAGAIIRRWATLKELWRLYEVTVKAGDRLADFIATVSPHFSRPP